MAKQKKNGSKSFSYSYEALPSKAAGSSSGGSVEKAPSASLPPSGAGVSGSTSPSVKKKTTAVKSSGVKAKPTGVSTTMATKDRRDESVKKAVSIKPLGTKGISVSGSLKLPEVKKVTVKKTPSKKPIYKGSSVNKVKIKKIYSAGGAKRSSIKKVRKCPT